MQHGAPGAGGRVAGEAGRHDEQQRLLRGEHGEGGEALERPGVGPVDVLDDEQERRRCGDARRQIAERDQRAVLARRRAHRRGERAQVGRRRDVEQVVQEKPPLGGEGALAARALERATTLVLVGGAGHAEQAAGEAAHRVAAGLGAEVEHRGGVARKAEGAGAGDELGDQARLADARVAADDDDAAALALGAGLGEGAEVAQLLVAADERRFAATRRLARAAHAPGDERLLLALDLDRRASRRRRSGPRRGARSRR